MRCSSGSKPSTTLDVRNGEPLTLPIAGVDWRSPVRIDIAARPAPLSLRASRPIALDTVVPSRLGSFSCAFDGGDRSHAWTALLAMAGLLLGAGTLARWWLLRAALDDAPRAVGEHALPWALPTVGAATLTITAWNTNKTYGVQLLPTVYTVSGLLNADSVTNVTLSSTGSRGGLACRRGRGTGRRRAGRRP